MSLEEGLLCSKELCVSVFTFRKRLLVMCPEFL